MPRPKRKTSIVKKPKSFKPKITRKLIRRFHVLLKARTTILARLGPQYATQAANDALYESYDDGATYTTFQVDGLAKPALLLMLGAIDLEIRRSGGLLTYQLASQQGQSAQRGSDSSKKLVQWLRATTIPRPATTIPRPTTALEIGCLSPNNFIAKCNLFDSITRVDLHSQHPLIIQSDFMDLPIPQSPDEKYDLVSCSLVLNFVPTPSQRGAMLERITQFLRPPMIKQETKFDRTNCSDLCAGKSASTDMLTRKSAGTDMLTRKNAGMRAGMRAGVHAASDISTGMRGHSDYLARNIQEPCCSSPNISQSHHLSSPNPPEQNAQFAPSGAFSPAKLFVVLPLPCVSNSRYFDQQLFGQIMTSLGFIQTHYHESHKLAYWLFDWEGQKKRKKFKKQEIHSGKHRNNFCIVMD